jgi:hypothetical protein
LCSSVTLPDPKSSAGRKGWVDVEGALALMFLKHYYQSSDAKVIETFNGSLHYQLFTGLVLSPGEQIKDETLLSSWRSKFGQYMDVELFQSDRRPVFYNITGSLIYRIPMSINRMLPVWSLILPILRVSNFFGEQPNG